MLTDKGVKSAQLKAKRESRRVCLSENLGHGRGTLLIDCRTTSTRTYYRYFVGRKMDDWAMGDFDRVFGSSVKAARAEANKLAVERDKLENGNLRDHREAQEEARTEARAAAQRAKEEAEAAKTYTVKKLCDIYGELKGRDAESGLKHFAESRYASLPANDLTKKQVAEVLRALVQEGKGRAAGKARSYLMAAYNLAIRAEGDATAPAALIAFDIQHNPVAGTDSLSQYKKSRDRALSEAEARAYWKRIKSLSGAVGDAIKLQYLTGGQRFEQLLRTEIKDVDLDEAIITIYDPKGRRTTPRPHAVPLCPDALDIVKRRSEAAKKLESKYLFTTLGRVPLNFRTLSLEIKAILGAMEKAGELASPAVPSDLRRTVETRLAALGISKETRGQLQSHGLNGVQARHYDRHDYLSEKRNAIAVWMALLSQEATANVTVLRTG